MSYCGTDRHFESIGTVMLAKVLEAEKTDLCKKHVLTPGRTKHHTVHALKYSM